MWRVAQLDDALDAESAFGRLVRSTRNARGWTLDQLRRRVLDGFGIDLSKTAMARLEQGNRPIRLNEVAAIARVLEIDLFAFGTTPLKPRTEDQIMSRAIEAAEAQLAAGEAEINQISDRMAMLSQEASRLRKRMEEIRRNTQSLRTHMASVNENPQDLDRVRALLDYVIGDSDGDR